MTCIECGGTSVIVISGQKEVYCIHCDKWVLTKSIISATIYPTKPTKGPK